MKAYDLKKGNVVEYNNGVYQIRDIERSSPQGRGGNVRFRFTMYSVPGGNKTDASFDGDDELKEVELLRRQASFSYKDGEAFVFMDDEDADASLRRMARKWLRRRSGCRSGFSRELPRRSGRPVKSSRLKPLPRKEKEEVVSPRGLQTRPSWCSPARVRRCRCIPGP